jgi:hypothetical protein
VTFTIAAVTIASFACDDYGKTEEVSFDAEIEAIRGQLRNRDLQHDSLAKLNERLRKLAFQKGRAEAASDVERHCPRICTMGFAPRTGIDDSTGFVYKTIAGCVITGYVSGYARGYGGYISEWIEANGIPEWSRKRWVDELRSARNMIENGHSKGEGIRIPDDESSTYTSPSGRWSVAIDPPDEKYKRYPLRIKDENGNSYQSSILWVASADEKKLVWGPEGSDVVGVSWRDLRQFKGAPDTVKFHVLLDLRNGGAILWERDSSWERQKDAKWRESHGSDRN